MSNNNEAILKIRQPDGTLQDIGLQELALSNHVTYQALVTLLLRKGVFEAGELLDEVNRVHSGRLGGE